MRYVICAFFESSLRNRDHKESRKKSNWTSNVLDEIDSRYGEWFEGPEEVKPGDLKGGDHITVRAEMDNLFPYYRAHSPA